MRNNFLPESEILSKLELSTCKGGSTTFIDESDTELVDIIKQLSDSANIVDARKGIKQLDIALCNMAFIYQELVKGTPLSHIAKSLGINRDILYRLKRQNRYFQSLMARADEEQVEVIRQSLLSKATDKYVVSQKVTPTGKVIDYQKYVPADFNAIKFFLLNKDGESYKDRQEIAISRTEYIVDIIDSQDSTDSITVEQSEDKDS